jgi:hypothetical protein
MLVSREFVRQSSMAMAVFQGIEHVLTEIMIRPTTSQGMLDPWQTEVVSVTNIRSWYDGSASVLRGSRNLSEGISAMHVGDSRLRYRPLGHDVLGHEYSSLQKQQRKDD